MNLLHRFIVLLSLLLFSNITFADCFLNNTTTPNGATIIGESLAGQQFLACESGEINVIQINTSGEDIHLYLIKGDGSEIERDKPYQIFKNQPAGLISLKLKTPFRVEENRMYAFAIGNTNHVIFDREPTRPPLNPDAPDGQFAFEITDNDDFKLIANSDLVFGINIAPPPPLIPTLSHWGLLIFGLLLLNFSLILIKSQQAALRYG